MRFTVLIATSALLLGGMAQADTKLVGGDMYFHGTIRALACSLAPGGDKIEVDFGQIATQDLYLSGRSKPKNSALSYATATRRCFAGSRSLSAAVRMPSWRIIWRWIAVNKAPPESALE